MSDKFKRISSTNNENITKEAQLHSIGDYAKYFSSGAAGVGAGSASAGGGLKNSLLRGLMGGLGNVGIAAFQDIQWSILPPKEKVYDLSDAFDTIGNLLKEKLKNIQPTNNIPPEAFNQLLQNITLDIGTIQSTFSQAAKNFKQDTLTPETIQNIQNELSGKGQGGTEFTTPTGELPPLPPDINIQPNENALPPEDTQYSPNTPAPTVAPSTDSTAPIDIGSNYGMSTEGYQSVKGLYASQNNKFTKISISTAPPKRKRPAGGSVKRPPASRRSPGWWGTTKKFLSKKVLPGTVGIGAGAGTHGAWTYLADKVATPEKLVNELKTLITQAIGYGGPNFAIIGNPILSKLNRIIQTLKKVQII